jgi:ABC-2 type transport system ATP-binding protein
VIPRDDFKPLSPAPEILVADGLRKSYGPRCALQGLSFSLRAGHILGFLGPNGAGKTTSIRILTTLMEPDSGHFVIDGIDSQFPARIRQRIGVLPENLGFPKQMTGLEYLTYFGQLYGRTASEASESALALLEMVGMHQRANSLIGSYSRGMRQRLGIARALVNDPVIVFLDEPTLGLDLRGRHEFLELVQRIARERSVAVVLCSHLLSEIEGICDDVIILNVGHVVAKGSVAEVINRVQKNLILRNILRLQVPPELTAQSQKMLESIPHIIKIALIGGLTGYMQLEIVGADNGNSTHVQQINNKILMMLLRAKIPILRFEIEGGRLEDVFLHLTEDVIR